MSLSVTTYSRDQETDQIIDDPYPENGEDLAGPESWRLTVWGAQSKGYGATVLPRLANEDLYIEGAELFRFLDECHVLLNAFDSEPISHRLSNMIRAGERAILNGGGVLIS